MSTYAAVVQGIKRKEHKTKQTNKQNRTTLSPTKNCTQLLRQSLIAVNGISDILIVYNSSENRPNLNQSLLMADESNSRTQ